MILKSVGNTNIKLREELQRSRHECHNFKHDHMEWNSLLSDHINLSAQQTWWLAGSVTGPLLLQDYLPLARRYSIVSQSKLKTRLSFLNFMGRMFEERDVCTSVSFFGWALYQDLSINNRKAPNCVGFFALFLLLQDLLPQLLINNFCQASYNSWTCLGFWLVNLLILATDGLW